MPVSPYPWVDAIIALDILMTDRWSVSPSKIGNNKIAAIAGAVMVPGVVTNVLHKYAYTIIALFQPSQAKEQRVAGEILTIPPSQLSICSSFCVYTFPDRRCAESAPSAVCIPGKPPLLGQEASSNPILTLNDWC